MKNQILPLIAMLALCASVPSWAEVTVSAPTVIYETPVPDALRPFSRFEMQYKAKQLGNGIVELEYELPATLIGKPMKFRFQGNADYAAPSFSLQAENAEMNCVTNQGAALCRVVHHNVVVDVPALEKALSETNLSLEEQQGRLELSQFMAAAGGDWAGVMTYATGFGY